MALPHRLDAAAAARAAGPRRDGRAAPRLEVRPLRPGDHRWVAGLHVAELPHGLFPRLGPGFVRRWHRAHVASPHGVGFVALEDGRPVGFALGSLDRRAHVAWLLAHRRVALGLPGALALLVRPRLLVEFLRTRAGRYARRLLPRAGRATAPQARTPGGAAAGPVAVLEAVVVVPGARTRGIGTRLVDAFLAEAVAHGAARAELVTKAGDGGAAGFYERRGWQRVGDHTDRDGDVVHTFRLDLGPRRTP